MAICLLRGLKDQPISQTATVSTTIGDVKMTQTIGFLEFNPKTPMFKGYQMGRSCLPVIGCLDTYYQEFTLTLAKSPLDPKTWKAGQIPMASSYSLETEVTGMSQGASVGLNAIKVFTPYGVFSAHPAFSFKKSLGWVTAPYDGSADSSLPIYPGSSPSPLYDLYGRMPGALLSKGYDFGWVSQLAFGNRNPRTDQPIWKSTGKFSSRPDADLKTPRSTAEKTANVILVADAKLKFSPTDMLPSWLTDNDYISTDFEIYVDPMLIAAGSSQFNIWGVEAPGRNAAGRLNYRALSLFGGPVSDAVFQLVAGINLKIHLSVGFIDEDLINIHPQTNIGKSEGTDLKVLPLAGAWGKSDSYVPKTHFSDVVGYQGKIANGDKFIASCLASPPASAPPPKPSFQPGNPGDLLKGVLYPCNICLGMKEKTYTDPKTGKLVTLPAFLETKVPVSEAPKPLVVRWTCNDLVKVGCYDQCSYSPKTGKYKMQVTAIEALEQGNKVFGRCKGI